MVPLPLRGIALPVCERDTGVWNLQFAAFGRAKHAIP